MAAHGEPNRNITARAAELCDRRREVRGGGERFGCPYPKLEFRGDGPFAAAGGFDFDAKGDEDVVEGGVGEGVDDEGAGASGGGCVAEPGVLWVEDQEVVEFDVGVVGEDGFACCFGSGVDGEVEFGGGWVVGVRRRQGGDAGG